MSLKARIEAVIYAAEDPVTLAQLAALFGDDLREARAERLSAEAASRESASESASASSPETATLPLESSPESESASSPEAEVVAPVETEAPASSDVEAIAQGEAETAAPVEESAEEAAKRIAQEEKRAARERDREAREEARGIVAELIADYANSDRGMEVREIAGGYRMATKPEYHDAVRGFIKSLKPPMKLSLPALETLAVIAYKQPVTAPEVSEIRGVDSSGVLGSLVSRKLITTAGRKQVIGRPILYKTTKEFLLRFGLKDLKDLPSMEEFEKMAGELIETEDAEPETSAENTDEPTSGQNESVSSSADNLPLENAEASAAIEPPSSNSESAAEAESTGSSSADEEIVSEAESAEPSGVDESAAPEAVTAEQVPE